jgi:hypothetical protein
VLDLVVDPSFYRDLELPDLELRDVVGQEDEGSRASIVLRYEYVGQLDPIVYRVLGTRPLTWLQTVAVDRADVTGELDIAIEASSSRLDGRVAFTFAADHDAGCLRQLDGEVRVNVPFLGGQAERRIVPGFLRRLDIEAEYLARRLAG